MSETTSGTQGGTTYYLIDSNNPTGYAKPIEQWVSTTGNRSTATLSMSYCLGDRVLAQVNGSGVVSYLLIDGQDNTRALTNSSGAVTATFNYNAFGDVLGATYTAANPPPTMYLFQQTMFDAPSGLNIFGDGVREAQPGEDSFIESDTSAYGNLSDPTTLNLRLLDGANPISNIDQNGHSYATDLGKAVHNAIGKDFIDNTDGHGITFRSIFTILGLPYSPSIGTLLPDLVYYDKDANDKEVFEVKPDNARQIVAGYFQLAAYVITLNKLDKSGGWTVGKWSTYTPSFHILETTDPIGLVVITELPGGLIVYDSLQQYAEKQAEKSAEAESEDLEADIGEDALTEFV